ncbi:MAG TPA: CsgG/HfaB family protein [Bdellovibrionales bacterium]|nr:CsgG/HfaB family protein [Bdellovibrionales bacterium]
MKILRFVSCGILISAAVISTGCSLFSGRKDTRSQPEVRDVSFQARETRDESPRKRIMVLPFIDASQGTRAATTAQYARDAFIKTLKRGDDFVIVSNTDFPKDIATYLKNGEYDLEAMGKIAGGMGLAGVMEGKIVDIKAKRIGDEVGIVRQLRARITATVQIRMVNTKNGSIAINEMRTADVEDSTTRVAERSYSDRMLEDDPKLIESVITEAFKSTVPRIVQSLEKLSWEGRVALVKGDRIYLNAGRISGLMIGDILKVSEEGEDVYDPDTGSLIGKVPGRLKGTIEVISYFGKDGSIGIIHSGSGFRENDRVELY